MLQKKNFGDIKLRAETLADERSRFTGLLRAADSGDAHRAVGLQGGNESS